MPHIPVVHVAIVFAARRPFEVGARRARPVGRRRRVFVGDTLENAVKEYDVIFPDAIALGRCDRFLEAETIGPGYPSGFNLVIPAPEHDAGMIAQPLYLLFRFLANVFLEGE